ncbi:MAG: M23 family metallopeptidase [Alphaproteobacteria bacterium]|nr:M23 family metallopeptidase [Alphaproteobacteria bacterium]MCW5741589.1 M23 family metallopeptidase [Alphaproteobacteria bacterium]
MAQLFYRPVHPWIVTQRFGANQVCIDVATGTKIIACDGLNPPPGFKSVYSMMKGHNALDLMATRWQPVYAAREGVVSEVETEASRGLGVAITHDFGPEGRFKTRYWHFAAIDVHLGETVSTGQLIGYADSTGYSTGDHLHFEVKPLNPDGSNMYQANGFFGATDPTPYMFDEPAVQASFMRQLVEVLARYLDLLTDKMRMIKTPSA